MLGQSGGSKVTRLSKALSALLVVGCIVSYFVPDAVSYLALVPGRTLPCVWNLVTAGFLTTNPIKVVVEVVLLLLLARVIEPMYGSKEFLKFIFIVDIATCFAVFAGVYVAFALTQSGTLLYSEFAGFHGIVAGLLVGVKQIMPDHEIKLFGFIKITVKYLPILLVLLATGLAVALQQYTMLPFLYFGMYSAWVYLRFFQQQPDTAYQGDPSEDFRFSGFFPSFLAPVIDPIGTLFGFIFRLRHTAPSDAKPLHMSGAPSMLGSDAADANRRRERGAKALEERLGLKKQGAESDVEKASPAAVGGETAPPA